MKIITDKSRPKLYCICEHCDKLFQVGINKVQPAFYCSKQCNDKAYYINKKKQLQ